jgi:hypothetical protein
MNHENLPPRNPKFDFLTDIEISELIEGYYGKIETVKSLIERFKLPVTTNIENYLPWFPSDELCSHCEGQMYVEPHHRNRRPNNPLCLECNHANISNCNCQTCLHLRNEVLKRKEILKTNLILEHIKQDTLTKIDFSKLTAEEKISLGILVRYLSSEDLTHLTPLLTKENWKNNKHFILPLINSKILTINIESDFGYIEIKENKFKESVLNAEYYKMKWDINVEKDGMTPNELFQYLAKPNDFYKLTGEQIFRYWQKTAKDETQKYLEYNFEQVLGIQYGYSLPIQKLLESLTYHFSIGQIYNLIWKYTNNTLRFVNERRYVTDDHVHNYLLKCIKTVSEKIIKNNYTLEHFDKPGYLGNSIFTDFFFRYVLKETGQEHRITPGYFYEKYNLKMELLDLDEFLKNENNKVENGSKNREDEDFEKEEPFENLD